MVVGDDQELSACAQARDHLTEAVDVRVVERSIDLVEDGERARVDLVERKHEGEGGERALTRGEQGHVLQALARRLDEDLHASAGTFVAVGMAQGRAPTW